jgi:ATP-dependent DNA helicase RecG
LRRLQQLADIDVATLRRVGEKRSGALGQMGISNVFDLLTTYPRRYVDRTRQVDLSDLTVGEEVAVFGEVASVTTRRTRHGKSLVEITVRDDGEGSLKVVFFNQPWRSRQLALGTQALFFSTVAQYRGERQMTNPVVDVLVGASGDQRDPARVGRVVPIYPASGKAGLTSWDLGGFIEESLERAGEFFDPLSSDVRAPLQLIERTDAFRSIHLPEQWGDQHGAARRLIFDEFLRLQVLLVLRRRRMQETAAGVSHPATVTDLEVERAESRELSDSLVASFLRDHRFSLTGAQRRVLTEIFDDLTNVLPMHRLLQGDVGSGKTMVALCALLAVVQGGRQGALMAPTEVLAEQHLSALRRDVSHLTVRDDSVLGGRRPVRVELLSGRLRAKARAELLGALASGAIDIVVGTHALLTDDVRFGALGLVVIDEQHRFGVEQRALLRDKGREHSTEGADPDLLVMTATPIPRTAAMVLFGDLDLSLLDEMPAGRQPITTKWLPDDANDAWTSVREHVGAGRQAFVVCPLVEESERIQAASAVVEVERLRNSSLNGLRVGLLHAQMRAEQKDEVMDQFRQGDLDVLVATVVIEVGVDVPNATVMVIEDAWRFGLAQLHQLRGRVGRGGGESFCFLLGEAPTQDAERRLTAIEQSTDGFVLAEVDLELRGEGTILGARQRGRSDLRLASLRRDGELLDAARVVASDMVNESALTEEFVDELRLFIDDDEAAFLFKS